MRLLVLALLLGACSKAEHRVGAPVGPPGAVFQGGDAGQYLAMLDGGAIGWSCLDLSGSAATCGQLPLTSIYSDAAVGLGLMCCDAGGGSTVACYGSLASPPTLSAVSNPIIVSGSGGGQAVNMTGTNLTGCTAAHLDGISATSVFCSSTVLTFTPPATTPSATIKGVTVTTPGGTSSNVNAVYALPTAVSNAWYTPVNGPAQGYTSGSWVDLIGGLTLATISGATAPTITSSWSNSQPSTTYAGSHGLTLSAVPSVAQPFSVFLVGTTTNNGSYDTLFSAGAGSAVSTAFTNTGTTELFVDLGASIGNGNVLVTSTPELLEVYGNGNSSTAAVNNGTQYTYSGTGFDGVAGFTVGSFSATTMQYGLYGSIGLIMVYRGTPTNADRIVIHGIAIAIYATP